MPLSIRLDLKSNRAVVLLIIAPGDGRVAAEFDGLQRPPSRGTCGGEAKARIRAKRVLARVAAHSVAHGPTLMAARLNDKIQAADFLVGELDSLGLRLLVLEEGV